MNCHVLVEVIKPTMEMTARQQGTECNKQCVARISGTSGRSGTGADLQYKIGYFCSGVGSLIGVLSVTG